MVKMYMAMEEIQQHTIEEFVTEEWYIYVYTHIAFPYTFNENAQIQLNV